MHDTAYKIGGLAMQLYCDLPKAAILEIGAQNVNGTLRDFIMPTTRYVGLDIEAGQGVDMVMEAGASFPVGDSDFDLVMATSVFEHDPAFWMTFVEMCRKARLGGYVYINAPSNGAFHQYPHDHWRFYPDCGLALVKWAQSQGQDMELVETFLAEREKDTWNDFVAVFRKRGGQGSLPDRLISDEVLSTNVRSWRSSDIVRRRDRSQDMELIQKWKAETQQLAKEMEEMRQRLTERSDEIRELTSHSGNLEHALATMQNELAGAHAKLSHMESALAQRQEELSQAYGEIEEQKEVCLALNERLNESELRHEQAVRKCIEADSWVFRLAGDRRKLEAQVGMLQRRLDNADTERQRLDAAQERLTSALEKANGLRLSAERRTAELELAYHRGNEHTDRLEIELVTERERNKTRFEEIATLTQMLRNKEDEFSQAILKADEGRKAANRLTASLEQVCQRESSRAEQLAAELREKENAALVFEKERLWLRDVSALLLNASGSGSAKSMIGLFLPTRLRLKKLKERLKQNGIFDDEAYLAANPDVAQEGVDPLLHYIKHGMDEGRQR